MRRVTLLQRVLRHIRRVARFLIPVTNRRPSPLRVPMIPPVVPPRNSPRRRHRQRAALTALLALGWSASLPAAVIYVDSRTGNDAFDGFSATQLNDHTGPVRTLLRAAQIVEAGDQIFLANNNTPYYGGASLAGLRQSGFAAHPIEIIGNGSIITGARPIAPESWQPLGNHLWRITPLRKGWYQLILDDAAAPEVPSPPDATELPELPEGHWCVWRGAIYYRSALGQDPQELDLKLADIPTGLTLVDVENVVIRDLTFRHFQQDGIHLAQRCRNVRLENVTSLENGRAGIVVRGSSDTRLEGTRITGNRVHSLLVEELGRVEISDTEITPRPTVVER